MRWFVRRGLRVLMYHKVSRDTADEHTVTPEQLAAQLGWLRAEGFQFVRAADLLSGGALPRWPVLVTFDDAYLDTFELARPVLRELGVPAVVFVPTSFIGRTNVWDGGDRPLMNADQLRALAADGFELGLHSHAHANYATLTAAQIADDVEKCFAVFRALALTPVPALAYPYGKRPARAARAAMAAALRERGVQAAFRIGNRINRLPVSEAFEINRLGMRGDESLEAFQRKIYWGRLM